MTKVTKKMAWSEEWGSLCKATRMTLPIVRERLSGQRGEKRKNRKLTGALCPVLCGPGSRRQGAVTAGSRRGCLLYSLVEALARLP